MIASRSSPASALDRIDAAAQLGGRLGDLGGEVGGVGSIDGDLLDVGDESGDDASALLGERRPVRLVQAVPADRLGVPGKQRERLAPQDARGVRFDVGLDDGCDDGTLR